MVDATGAVPEHAPQLCPTFAKRSDHAGSYSEITTRIANSVATDVWVYQRTDHTAIADASSFAGQAERE